ncbi:MAG: GNAT family N-acetyltransferase [Anaerolineales bacterium]|nr:GNAT family N-acetyltransferase [Anaerolineales bacterium]
MREVRAKGLEAQALATMLLQRARLADPLAGVWEAADVQWWWRKLRQSDEVEKLFWIDEDGPVTGVLLTGGGDEPWQCDLLVVPHSGAPDPGTVWQRALEHAAQHATGGFEIPVSDDDAILRGLAVSSGLVPGGQDCTAWMDASARPAVSSPPGGFVLADCSLRPHTPHPMRQRNGADVAQRLAECTLYDPALDLAIEAADGRLAAYSLYWFDPVTKVGLVEPVRVEDEFQRQGLARVMLAAGIERLARKGAQRIKVSYQTEAAAALYQGIGFQQTSTTTWHRAPSGNSQLD